MKPTSMARSSRSTVVVMIAARKPLDKRRRTRDAFLGSATAAGASMASANQVVIVTGAASGIGLAMTMGLITAGHDVTAVDRNAAGLTELGKQAERLNRGSVHTVTADLAHPDSFGQVTAAALIKYRRIDALVNNAGIGQASVRGGRGPIRFWETTPEQWGRFIAINAGAAISMARAVLPHMLAAGQGRIIAVTTSLGTMVREGHLLYGSS